MSHLLSTTAIARTLLLAGILLAVTVLAVRSFFPAFAQEGEDDAIAYLEGREDVVTSFTAMDQDDGDILEWRFLVVDGNPPTFNLDGDGATDPEPIFTIRDGDLEFVSPPDYESPWATREADSTLEDLNTYKVIVEVTDDDHTTPLTATTSVTIKVANKNEDGTVTFSTLQPLEGIDLVATLTDPDGRVGDDGEVDVPTDGTAINTDLTDHATTTWKWARSRDGQTGWVDIVATTTDNPEIDKNTRKPETADIGHHLRVTATYNDGHGEGKTAPIVSANSVLKNLENDHPVFRHSEGNEYTNAGGDIREDPPVTVDEPISDELRLVRRVDEKSASGSDVGDPVEAYDDDGDVLTYEFDSALAGEAFNDFEIDRRTGQITIGQGTELDYDLATPPTFTVTVLAADPSYPGDTNSRDSIKVTIIVDNIPESPVITAATPTEGLTAKELNESVTNQPTEVPYTPIVAVYRATDEEDDVSTSDQKQLTWRLYGNDMDAFQLCDDASGVGSCTPLLDGANEVQLRFNTDSPPDHDNPTDTGKNNVYNVTVEVEDSDETTDSRNVAVTVLNVEEDGSVTLSHPQPEVGTGITATLSDPDKVFNGSNVRNLSPSWRWYHSDGTAATSSSARSRTYTPHASDIGQALFAVATYTDGEGSGKSATSTNSANAVRAATPNDEEPEFDEDAGSGITRTIPETTEAGAQVGSRVVADDDEGDVFVYELKGTNASSFTLDQFGQISVAEGTVFDYETKTSYSVEVRALGPSGSSDIGKTTVTIMITNFEESPEITGGNAEISVDEGTAPTTVLQTYTGTDDEDKKRSKAVVWSVHDENTTNADPSDIFTIGNSASDRGKLRFKNRPDYENPFSAQTNDPLREANTYTVYVRATDNGTMSNPNDTRSTTETVMVEVVNKNEEGSVTFSSLQPLQDVQLDATLRDPDGMVPVGEVVLYPIDDNLTEHATTTWKWERSRSSTSGWVEITATTTDNLMIDTHMRTPEESDVGFYLRATATYTDGQGENKTKSGVTAERVLKNLDNDTPVFRHSEGNRYTLANDPTVLASDAPDVPARVNAPIPDSHSLVREVDENSGAGTAVGSAVAAYDDDGDTLTYSLSANPENRFGINAGTGLITVGSGTTLDFETVANATYHVDVKATDPSNASSTVNVTIKVADVNDDPMFTGGASEITLTEISDDLPDDTGDAPMIMRGTNDAVALDDDYNSMTGEVAIDEYSATDQDDTASNDALNWSLSGNDMELFAVCSEPGTLNEDCDQPTGGTVELRFKAAPDFENQMDTGRDNTYDVTVVVTDSDNEVSMREVIIKVTNVEESGKVTLSNQQPEVGIGITAELEDPDGGVVDADVEWQWHWAEPESNGDAPDRENGTWNLIRGATSATYIPVAGDPDDDVGKFLRATATYSDNSVPNDDTSTTNIDESEDIARGLSEYKVQPEASTNETPQFPDQDPDTAGKQAEREVDENTPPGIDFDTAVAARDVDDFSGDSDVDMDVVTYTLGGTHAALFGIDPTSGQLRVGDGTELDHESDDTYRITVTATDSSLATDMITVTIKVNDVNEAPTINMVEQLRVRGETSPPFDENQTGTVATYTATVPDGSTPTWSKSGADSSVFTLSGGVLSIDSALDYEPHSDANSDNVYEVTVTATASGMSRSLDVDVTLSNVDEPGTVSISPSQPPYRVGDVLSASLDEGDDETVTGWQWARSTTASGTFTPIGGATNNTYTPVDPADVGNFLQVTVTYDQPLPLPSGQQESSVTASAVLAASTADNPGTLALSPTTQLTSGDTVTATLTDADNPVNQAWQWARSSTASGTFTNISNATSASYTTTDADAGNYLRATVTYDDDSGTGKTAEATTNAAIASATLINAYDGSALGGNEDGIIQIGEAIKAVQDFFTGRISIGDAIEVVQLYFAGLRSGS